MAKKKIEKKYWRNLLSTSNNLKRLLDKYEYIVFFDTETTGLNTSKERIIQISAIKTDKELTPGQKIKINTKRKVNVKMKRYEKPELEICVIGADVITASDPTIIDRGYDLPGIPALLQ